MEARIALRPGARLGRYECVRPLARGGMAELYLARRRFTGRSVVVKRVRAEFADDEDVQALFVKEARIASALRHQNIAQVLDFGADPEGAYLVLEYVPGWSLRDLLKAAVKRDDALPLGVALGIARDVATALEHAHSRRDRTGRALEIVHRDVDPSNVLVHPRGLAKLVDFGIARTLVITRTTRASWLKGKVGYMSPEQCSGGHVDRRADIFALGILLYEMTTGYRLFHARTDYETTNKILAGDYVRPRELVTSYPEELEQIVVRTLERLPEDRYATAAEFRAALERFAASRGIETSTRVRAAYLRGLYPAAPRPRTRWLRAGVVAAAAILAAFAVTKAGSSAKATTAGVGLAKVDPMTLAPPPIAAKLAAPAPIVSPPPPKEAVATAVAPKRRAPRKHVRPSSVLEPAPTPNPPAPIVEPPPPPPPPAPEPVAVRPAGPSILPPSRLRPRSDAAE